MNRKHFFQLFSAVGVTVITVGAISCHHHSRRTYVVNNRKCNGCEKCIKRCFHHAIILKNEKAYIDLNICKYCGECEDFCKREAIISFKRSNA